MYNRRTAGIFPPSTPATKNGKKTGKISPDAKNTRQDSVKRWSRKLRRKVCRNACHFTAKPAGSWSGCMCMRI